MRTQTEDTAAQRLAVHAREHDLREALGRAEKAAKTARRTASRAAVPDLDEFHAASNAVRVAEEALDLALLDLRTASGEDA